MVIIKCKNIIAFIILTFAFVGCGSFVPTKDMSQLTPEQRHEISKIPIYTSDQLKEYEFEVINVIEGNSCQNKLWDPPATRALAVEQLKYYAWELKADGITDIQYGVREGTSVRSNCWELISCTAYAIKIKGKRQ